MDCFAALAMTVDIPSQSRGAFRPRQAGELPALLFRGRREDRGGGGCLLHPRVACDLRKQKCTRAYRAAGAFRPSLRSGFTAYFVLLCPQNLPECANGRF